MVVYEFECLGYRLVLSLLHLHLVVGLVWLAVLELLALVVAV
jgi:hypothetical protein